MLWLHAHKDNLAAAWPVASDAQQRILATALRFNFDKDATSPTWLDMVSRRISAKVDPGSTPKKRKAPDGLVDGQIRRPAADPPADDGAS